MYLLAVAYMYLLAVAYMYFFAVVYYLLAMDPVLVLAAHVHLHGWLFMVPALQGLYMFVI